jgi:hypothetical protein
MELVPPLWATGSWVIDAWEDGTWSLEAPSIIDATADVTVIVAKKAQTIVVNDTLGVTVR